MSPSPSESAARRAREREAAAWVVRESRGLTGADQDALSLWLAADPRHGAELAERRRIWQAFESVAALHRVQEAEVDPDLFAPSRSRKPRGGRVLAPLLFLSLAAAAAVVLWFVPAAPPPAPVLDHARALSTALAAPCETRTLDDGTVVELNRGARLAVDFSAGTRRVRLERGEAHFAVAKDPARPFVVEAGGVAVRALGTAFNVRLGATDVEVVVAEGTVAVERPAVEGPAPQLTARQSVTVPLVANPAEPPAGVAVATLSESDIVARLAWQPRLLDFADLPLVDAIGELNRRNPVQLVLGSPGLGERRVNATIRSDNVEGFVRLLESTFDLRAEWRSETEIVLLLPP